MNDTTWGHGRDMVNGKGMRVCVGNDGLWRGVVDVEVFSGLG